MLAARAEKIDMAFGSNGLKNQVLFGIDLEVKLGSSRCRMKTVGF
jgi:hypothetical protein